MIPIPAHELTFGDLVLTGATQPGAWTYITLGENMTFGTPQPVEQTVATLLQDGSMVVTRSHDNREASFQITIAAQDSITLAEGEKALFLECARRNTMTWRPPDGVGAVSVFDVITSSLEPIFDDVKELLIRRTYRLRVVCHPFTRSVEQVIAPALVVGGTPSTVTMSDGSSASGWTSPYGSVTASGGRIHPAYQYSGVRQIGSGQDRWDGVAEATLTMVAAQDFAATPYLYFDRIQGAGTYAGDGFSGGTPEVWVDGTQVAPFVIDSLPGGVTRYWFLIIDPSVTTFRIRQVFYQTPLHGVSPGAPVLDLDNVTRTNQPPMPGTGRSAMRLIDIEGSARTEGSIELSHATAGLGDVIVYTSPVLSDQPGGYRPDLSKWLSSGSRVTDTARISGARGPVGSAVFTVPAGLLPPGGYVLVARVADAGAAPPRPLFWKAETLVDGVVVGTAQSPTLTFDLADAVYQNVILPGLVLPPTRVPAESDGTVRITVDDADATNSWTWDEMWAFYCGDDTALTMVRCGTGTPAAGTVSNRLWLDSPTVDNPQPAVYVGTDLDRSNAFHAGALAAAWGQHNVIPEQTLVYVANSGGAQPALAVRHFPRWFTHAVS